MMPSSLSGSAPNAGCRAPASTPSWRSRAGHRHGRGAHCLLRERHIGAAQPGAHPTWDLPSVTMDERMADSVRV